MLLPFYQETLQEAGIDKPEGLCAGPVFAAAVILPTSFRHPLLNDSKQLSENKGTNSRPVIEKGKSICLCVALSDHKIIDKVNILQATYRAMHLAIEGLSKTRLLLIDGNRFKPFAGIPHQCFVKGDGRFPHRSPLPASLPKLTVTPCKSFTKNFLFMDGIK